MNKINVGIVITALLLLVATTAFAYNGANNNGTFSFRNMLPFMQQHHPDWSEEELKEMYEACHGTGESTRRPNNEQTFN